MSVINEDSGEVIRHGIMLLK